MTIKNSKYLNNYSIRIDMKDQLSIFWIIKEIKHSSVWDKNKSFYLFSANIQQRQTTLKLFFNPTILLIAVIIATASTH